jgi:hypothetical protein
MNRRNIFSLFATTALGLALLPGSTVAQQKSLKEQVTGIWTLVSSDSIAPDGSKRSLFGANPKGILIFDVSGRYVQVLTRSDVPKFKSNNRLGGTPEENTAVVRGTVAHFGTWLVDEASMILTLRTEGNMFPNLTGTDSARSIAVAGDELRLSNPAGTGGKVEVVMKRAM